LFVMQWLPMEILEKMKYFSKYLYEIYCHRRRLDGAYIIPRDGLEGPKYAYKYSGIHLWCDQHNTFYCTHSDSPMYLISDQQDFIGDDAQSFGNFVQSLGMDDRLMLTKMLRGKSIYEVLGVLADLVDHHKCKDLKMIAMLNSLKPSIQKGRILIRFMVSRMVVNEVISFFRKPSRRMISRMDYFNVRKHGILVHDRLESEKYIKTLQSLLVAPDQSRVIDLVGSFENMLKFLSSYDNNTCGEIELSSDFESVKVCPRDRENFEMKNNLAVVRYQTVGRKDNKIRRRKNNRTRNKKSNK